MSPSQPPRRSGPTRPRPATARPRTTAARRPAPSRLRPLGRPGTRLRGGLVILMAVILVLAGRLVQLQGLQSTAYAAQAANQRIQEVSLPATRGELLDRDGQPLALSVAAKNVTANPKNISKAVCQVGETKPCDPRTIAAVLAPMLKLDAGELTTKLSNSKKMFVYVAKEVDLATAVAITALKLPGIDMENTTKRVHPSHDLAAGVLGFTNSEGVGAAGLELVLQDLLAGTEGKVKARFDGFGRIIPSDEGSRVEPIAGRDVTLTLDRDLQWYAQQQLAAEVAKTQAVNGTVVVLDIKTGEVLALATAPTFDPDNRRHVSTDVMGNPAINEVYEPGSVNKVITAAAALGAGIVTPQTVFAVPGTYQVSDLLLHDAEPHGLEHLTFAGVLAKSSNIGTVMVAQQLGVERLYQALRSFGFGEKSGLGLPGESRGVVPKPADWSGTSIANIPIGQGLSTNVIQVASVYATIANGGVRVAPMIVASNRDSAGHVTRSAAPAQRRVISAGVAQQVRDMLESVVSQEGTAPQAAVAGYRVAGKTGTAQRVVNGRYQAGNYTSSFVGFAPAEAPRFVTAVVLQGTGKAGYFGGSTAGPVFSAITGFALRSMDIPPTGTKPPVLRLQVDGPVSR